MQDCPWLLILQSGGEGCILHGKTPRPHSEELDRQTASFGGPFVLSSP